MTVVYPYKDKDVENAYENAQEILKIKVNQLKESLVQTKKNQIQSDLNFVSNYSKEEYFSIISQAKEYIKKGDIFNEFNITTKRPNLRRSGKKITDILGKVSKKNYSIDDII